MDVEGRVVGWVCEVREHGAGGWRVAAVGLRPAVAACVGVPGGDDSVGIVSSVSVLASGRLGGGKITVGLRRLLGLR